MKNLLIASFSALALLASGTAFAKDPAAKKPVMTKSGKMSKAHTCNGADGKVVTTTEKTKGKLGRTIKREMTCTNEGGTWTPVNAPAAGDEKAPKAPKAKKSKAAKGDKKS